jgi:hypothetical protein
MEQMGRMPQKVRLNEDAVLTIHSHVPVTVTENLEQSTLPLTPKVIVKIRYVVTCR